MIVLESRLGLKWCQPPTSSNLMLRLSGVVFFTFQYLLFLLILQLLVRLPESASCLHGQRDPSLDRWRYYASVKSKAQLQACVKNTYS